MYGCTTQAKSDDGTAKFLNSATASNSFAAEKATSAPPTILLNPSNKAIKSTSIFLAIASPNNLPISAPTFLYELFLAKSVNVVIIQTSDAVIVTELGLTAVLDKSAASDTAAALTAA